MEELIRMGDYTLSGFNVNVRVTATPHRAARLRSSCQNRDDNSRCVYSKASGRFHPLLSEVETLLLLLPLYSQAQPPPHQTLPVCNIRGQTGIRLDRYRLCNIRG